MKEHKVYKLHMTINCPLLRNNGRKHARNVTPRHPLSASEPYFLIIYFTISKFRGGPFACGGVLLAPGRERLKAGVRRTQARQRVDARGGRRRVLGVKQQEEGGSKGKVTRQY